MRVRCPHGARVCRGPRWQTSISSRTANSVFFRQGLFLFLALGSVFEHSGFCASTAAGRFARACVAQTRPAHRVPVSKVDKIPVITEIFILVGGSKCNLIVS